MAAIVILIIIVLIIIIASSGSGRKPNTQSAKPSANSNKSAVQATSTTVSKSRSVPKSTKIVQSTPVIKSEASRKATPISLHAIKNSPPTDTKASAVPRKPDWHDFEKLVVEKKITALYHFTDKRNIPSIKKHGALYSWSYCIANKITIPNSASNELSKSLDAWKGLEDFVRLSFNPSQPMMYVAKKKGVDPFILEIAPEVIYWLETQFSNVNATANNAIVGSFIQHFRNINFDFALQGNWNTPEEKAFIQAEVLVRTKLPIHFIRNI
jgi:hypothetical protein